MLELASIRQPSPNPDAPTIRDLEVRNSLFIDNTMSGGFLVDGGGSLVLHDNCFQRNALHADLITFFNRGDQSYDIGDLNTVFRNTYQTAANCALGVRHLCSGCDGVSEVFVASNATDLYVVQHEIDLGDVEMTCFPFVFSNWRCPGRA